MKLVDPDSIALLFLPLSDLNENLLQCMLM